MDGRLNEFLNVFYETISFESVDKFDSLRFEDLFSRNAALVELAGGELRSETILEYVNRLLYELRHFPERYSHGISERQTACEAVEGEDFVFVKSEYEKRYFDGRRHVTAMGRNHIILCRDGDWFKILFIAWKGE